MWLKFLKFSLRVLLSVPGKLYGRALTERLMQATEEKVSGEEEGFRKWKNCLEIFTTKMLVEEYSGENKKLYAAFMDFEKSYDRLDGEALWTVLKIFGVEGS